MLYNDLFVKLVIVLLIMHSGYSNGQGCNDAGFCTIADMQAGAKKNDTSSFEAGMATLFRLGEKETAHLTLEARFKIQIWRSGVLLLTAPFQLNYGLLGFTSGPGDITPSFTQTIFRKETLRLSATLAGKLPSGNADKQTGTQPLPMAYQVSQGTTDLIAGASLFSGHWHFSVGWQHNFNANQNLYIDSLRSDKNTPSYFDSRRIDRGDDLLLRVEKKIQKDGKDKYFVGVLPIWRVQQATIENPAGERVAVKGTSGLTLNVNAGLLWNSGEKYSSKLLLGFPTITRHVRPDGLTGTFVIAYSASWKL